MQKLVNSPYLKEKGFLGPFSLTEALAVLAISIMAYIISCYCEEWLHYNRLWTIALACTVPVLSIFVKICLKNSNPTWLSSVLSYYFFYLKEDTPCFKVRLNVFLKKD
ncbi:protein of unknown function (plasmid) [Cardinium endosymbiont cEper1 of Encarsia pergandiella]|uniref:hypothetical protein n=1 Tax=Cardinium endosymbiont of Encarsia pergandiella TaxID=249402 RepID=UPI00027E9E19|nr:hypothetical protein [Cardinium endosymbiont of Encarsia pergandiella]CCM10645.1 protein of unknown function [Cardinium endosymbiont cEper1 of Encarsia pergandiella]